MFASNLLGRPWVFLRIAIGLCGVLDDEFSVEGQNA